MPLMQAPTAAAKSTAGSDELPALLLCQLGGWEKMPVLKALRSFAIIYYISDRSSRKPVLVIAIIPALALRRERSGSAR